MKSPTVRYDARTIALHWISATLIVLMWGGAHAIDWFPKGPLRVDARSVHIVVGAALVAIIGYRLVWRNTRGAAIAGTGEQLDRVAGLVHWLLYLLAAAVLLLGLCTAWVRGDNLFGIAQIPKYGVFDAASRHQLANEIVGWHRLAANCLLGLASGHGLMALFHRFVLRDDVLSRMV